MSITDAPDGPSRAGRSAVIVLGAALIVALAVVVPLRLGDTGGAGWIRTSTPAASAPGGDAQESSGRFDPAGTVTATVVTTGPPTSRAAAAPTSTTSAARRSTPSTSTTSGPSVPSVPTTMPLPSSTVTPAVRTVPPAPTTTATTAASCRNSTDKACGPFRFDPLPGPDRPMTVEVVPDRTTAIVGQEIVFDVTLTDPDGVSHESALINFGNSAIDGISGLPCGKFGPWDPPARNANAAVENQVVRHTYFEPGAYTVTFSFEPGPFSCVDSVTGGGDRPYASPGTASVNVVVG